jgi:DNA-binding CsgD family transcriptional regulator
MLSRSSDCDSSNWRVNRLRARIHIKNIFGKLEVIDRTQAVVTASQRGFIQL